MARTPPVLWAQRPNLVYLTIDLQEAKDPKISIDNTDEGSKLTFSGEARSHAAGLEDHEYELELDLYGRIVKEDAKISVNARNIVLAIPKEEEGSWPRLLRQSGKALPNVKVDWDKWQDSDDEDDGKGDFDLSGLQDMNNFDIGGGAGGMPGMPGMPGMGGMGGAGGMPDMSKFMGGGAGGGAPGMGGTDMNEILAKLKKGGLGKEGAGFGAGNFDDEEDTDPEDEGAAAEGQGS